MIKTNSLEDLLQKIKDNKYSIQIEKMYLTYSEYLKYSVIPKRKYRNNYKDKLMKISIINRLTFYIAKKRFYKSFTIDKFQTYGNHLLKHTKEYIDLYNSLADEQSKEILIEVLLGRFTGDFRKAQSKSEQYFEKELIQFKPNEVFVDCGAWIGDTTDIFLNYNEYPATCYIIEPDKINMDYAKKNLSNKKAIFHFISEGVSDQKETQPFYTGGDSGSTVINTSTNQKKITEIQLNTIDHIVKEPATFIKMDLEGFEIKALSGAKTQISQYHPKLAISIYHKPDDFITIFQLIKNYDLTNQYKYYIRHYSPMHNETILYAIPSE